MVSARCGDFRVEALSPKGFVRILEPKNLFRRGTCGPQSLLPTADHSERCSPSCQVLVWIMVMLAVTAAVVSYI